MICTLFERWRTVLVEEAQRMFHRAAGPHTDAEVENALAPEPSG